MKKVDKIPTKKDTGQVSSKSPAGKTQPGQQTLSPEQQLKSYLANLNAALTVTKEVFSTVKEIFSYLKEKEKTKQIIEQTNAQITIAHINLEMTKIETEIRRADIISDHQQEMAKIENVRIRLESINKAIDETLETIRLLRGIFQQTEDTQFLDKLHEQQLRLMDVAKSIAEM